MKRFVICLLSSAIMMAPSVVDLQAATKFTGDAGDTPATLEQFGDAPGPSIGAAGGNPGGVLVITEALNGQNNFVTFDNSDAGAFAASNFSFDFMIDPTDTGPSADGISFSYADTATYGTSGGIGAAPFTPEDPAAAGVLGFGFDTWSNQGANDDPNVPTGSDYQEISVFWNGALVDRIDDTRLLAPPLTLDDAAWHTVTGSVDFAGGTVDLSVDGNVIHAGLAVPGLAPMESRIMFAGRTGGENELAVMDNLNVEFVPEPSTGLMALICAATWIGCFRRRRRD